MAAKSPTKKAAATAPAKKSAPVATTSKAAPAKPAAATKSAKAAPAAPAKQPAKAATTSKQTTAKPATTKPATTKPTSTKPAAAKQPAAKASASKPTATSSGAGKATTSTAGTSAAPSNSSNGTKAASSSSPKTAKTAPDTMHELPKPKFNKEGLGYTKDFDLPFIKAQYDLLQQERIHLTGQAKRLEDEAHQLVEEAEMGDVQFDDEGGEGDTMVVERERDLALSAQARDAVAEIDAALTRIAEGTYGYSVISGKPIPKERLEAIPWSSVLVEEKVGGIGRR